MPKRPAARRPRPTTLKPETLRGAPGFYRVGQDRAGRWWLVEPDGTPTFGCGVDGVRFLTRGPDEVGTAARLEDWNFGVVGPASAPAFFDGGLAFIESLDLRKCGDFLFRLGGARLPDVFDPRWAEACEARVAGVTTRRGRIGFVPDYELGWAQSGTAGPRPALLQICLSLDPKFSAYHAAWEFALAPYGGDFGELARAWALDGPNKEALRQWTIEDRVIASPAYAEAQARFTAEFAQRYLRIAATLVRRYAPGVLLFAPPLPTAVGPVAETWADVRFLTDGSIGGGPAWLGAFSWVPGMAERTAPGRRSALERMHRDGRNALEGWIRDPAVVGYFWSDFAGGDQAADAPFGRGLVYEDGLPAHEHVQPLASINRAAVALRSRI